VVDHNTGRLGKTLRSERGEGKTPVLAFLPDQDEEAAFCGELIQKSAGKKGGKNGRYSDWAIVYRTNAQSLGFETEFLRRKIPYRVVGSLKFYEREEVKDTLALLSFLVNPRDEVAFRRVVNKPSRGVGPATVDRIVGEAENPADREDSPGATSLFSVSGTAGGDLAEAAQRLAPELSPKARAGIGAFLKAIEAGRAAIAKDAVFAETGDFGPGAGNPLARAGQTEGKKKTPSSREGLRSGAGLSECVVRLAEESGIAEYHLTHDEIAGNQRLSNLQEVANAASLYPATPAGLLEFLEHIELDRSMEEASGGGDDTVTLITLHNTKGLEFHRVIMTGIEQGVFPRDDKLGEDLEEERRLFYVGATRAMDELYFTSCAMRRMYGRASPMEPSLFLREIDREGLRLIGAVPYGFGPSPFQNTSFRDGPDRPAVSSDGRWRVGDRVFHDDHGYGGITKIQEGDDGPVVRVVFDTGHETRFSSLYQSSSFTKIGKD
jgi:DNA helicase-2/ATP-dependent DNA helicase PcrA